VRYGRGRIPSTYCAGSAEMAGGGLGIVRCALGVKVVVRLYFAWFTYAVYTPSLDSLLKR
jgi:hypothetical protein